MREMIATGTTSVKRDGTVDQWLNENRTPVGPLMYFTTLAFYGLAQLVFEGLKAALPRFANSKGRYWVVLHHSHGGGSFFWADSGNSVFICRNMSAARQLTSFLRGKQPTCTAASYCTDLMGIGEQLAGGYNIYIQVVEGEAQPHDEMPVMRLDIV